METRRHAVERLLLERSPCSICSHPIWHELLALDTGSRITSLREPESEVETRHHCNTCSTLSTTRVTRIHGGCSNVSQGLSIEQPTTMTHPTDDLGIVHPQNKRSRVARAVTVHNLQLPQLHECLYVMSMSDHVLRIADAPTTTEHGSV